jgi:hypothetical protein
MTHDPHLAASLHEMLSTVTAIRSAASILAEPGEVDAEWQARFHRNIYEDSARLAETSRGLVTYLEADETSPMETGAPQEELDAALEAAGHTVPDLETGTDVAVAHQRLGKGMSGPARELLRAWLERYTRDAQSLPVARLRPALDRHGPDPAALAADLGADVAQVMRRLAALPPEVLATPVGLAICDSSGVLIYRKPLPDFPMPRFGAACPLWPLYRALSRPFVILAGPVMQGARGGLTLWSESLATPQAGPAVNADPLYRSQMLVRPLPPGIEERGDQPQLGMACRVCVREACEGRREPSILAPAVRR